MGGGSSELAYAVRSLVEVCKPLGSAKFIVMKTLSKPSVMHEQRDLLYPWPYTEGLAMDEAMNDLAFIATGLYGKPILNDIALEGFIFAGMRRGKGLSNMAMLKTLERMGHSDLTTHGFHSTFRDWAAETTEHRSEIVEMALAHTIDNKVEAAYRRGEIKAVGLPDVIAKYQQSARYWKNQLG